MSSPAEASLCVLPWIHTHIGTTGFVQLCCVSGTGEANPPVFGTVREQSLAGIFTSDRMAAVRRQMLAGVWPAECEYCRLKEARGVKSSRQVHNERYPAYYQQLLTNPGELAPKLRSIDLRLNNVCNFRCRSCSAYASSAWFTEHNLIYPDIGVGQPVIGFHDVPSFWEEFRTTIQSGLEHIHIAGGEPLVTEEHYLLLEALIEAGKTDLELYYDTNLSQLTYKRWNVVDLWQRFPDLTLSLSLDGVGARGEYIRHGLDYAQWLKNIETIKRRVPHAKRKLHFVVSIFNVIDLPEHLRTILEEGLVTSDRLRLTFLTWPPYLNAQVLPPFLKEHCAERLREVIDDAAAFGEPVISQVRALLQFLYERDLCAAHGGELAQKVAILDRLRGENAAELFPYLQPMLATG